MGTCSVLNDAAASTFNSFALTLMVRVFYVLSRDWPIITGIT